MGRPQSEAWKYFTKHPPREGEKLQRAQCALCGFETAGGTGTRLGLHLAEQCLKVPLEVKEYFQEKYAAKRQGEGGASSAGASSPTSKRQKISSADMPTAPIQSSGFLNIDRTIARFFYGGDISFSLVESIPFFNMMKDLRPGYTGPSRKDLATTLLDSVYEEETEAFRKKISEATFVSILCNGWDQSLARSFATFTVRTPTETLFHSAVEYNALAVTPDLLVSEISKVIEDLGPQNVAAVVITYTRSTREVMTRLAPHYHSISFLGCTESFTRALATDFINLPWVSSIVRFAHGVGALCQRDETIASHRDPSLTNTASVDTSAEGVASVCDLVSWILPQKQVVQAIVQNRPEVAADEGLHSSILDDGSWERMRVLVDVLKPLKEILDAFDQQSGCFRPVSQVYARYYALELVWEYRSAQIPDLAIFLQKWWRQGLFHPIMLQAYVLDPLFFGNESTTTTATGDMLAHTLGSISSALGEDALSEMMELNDIRAFKGLYAQRYFKDTIATVAPSAWWNAYISKYAPSLAHYAFRVLSLPSCASVTTHDGGRTVADFVDEKQRLPWSTADMEASVPLRTRIFKLLFLNRNLEGARSALDKYWFAPTDRR